MRLLFADFSGILVEVGVVVLLLLPLVPPLLLPLLLLLLFSLKCISVVCVCVSKWVDYLITIMLFSFLLPAAAVAVVATATISLPLARECSHSDCACVRALVRLCVFASVELVRLLAPNTEL